MSDTKATILIIEDDSALSDAFSMILHHKGYSPVTAYNGCEALDYLEQNSPHVILLDILMPVMDGREFLVNFENPQKIPVIALSNLDAKSDIEQIVKLGATSYTLKSSITPDVLVELIEQHLPRNTAS